MRRRKIANNEYVDEYGNVKKLVSYNGYNRYGGQGNFIGARYGEEKASNVFIEFLISFLRVFWVCVKAIFRFLGRGLKILAVEMRTKPHQRVVWDGVMPAKRTPKR
jgi:hypothetical protein